MKKASLALQIAVVILSGITIISTTITFGVIYDSRQAKHDVFRGYPVVPYQTETTFERSPIKTIPIGYLRVKSNPDANISEDYFVGVDPSVIPPGTHLYIVGLGFRVAIKDSSVVDKAIAIYGDTHDTEYYVWVISLPAEKSAPFIVEL